jgi:hypothetical protein
MKVRWLSIALLFSLLVGAVGAPVSVQSQSSGFTAPVAGGAPNVLGGTDVFEGTLTITSFDRQGSDLVANAVLDGKVSDLNSTVIGNIRRFAASPPVPTVKASCERLDLELDKVAVKVEGFDIKLDKVVFAISIKDYPDKKVGKLLCNLAKKLEKGNPPYTIANELNHLLREIGR